MNMSTIDTRTVNDKLVKVTEKVIVPNVQTGNCYQNVRTHQNLCRC